MQEELFSALLLTTFNQVMVLVGALWFEVVKQ